MLHLDQAIGSYLARFSLYSLIFIFSILQLCNYGIIMVVVDVIGSLDTCITLHISKRCYIIVVVVKLAHCSNSSIVDLNYFPLIFLEFKTQVM